MDVAEQEQFVKNVLQNKMAICVLVPIVMLPMIMDVEELINIVRERDVVLEVICMVAETVLSQYRVDMVN